MEFNKQASELPEGWIWGSIGDIVLDGYAQVVYFDDFL